MTDGVHDIVSYTELENILKKGETANAKRTLLLKQLDKQANKRGDNATVIVIAIRGQALKP